MNMRSFWQSPSRVPGFFFSIVAGGIIVSDAEAQPRIDTLSSSRSKIRDNIIIQGANFSPNAANNAVFFGGVRVPLQSASSSRLSVTVPAGVSYGPVSVTVDGLAGWSRQYFSSALPTVGNVDSSAFGPYVEFTVGGAGQENTAAGDLDGDGRVDLVSPHDTTISILQNTSQPGAINSSSFGSRLDLPSGGNAMAAAVGDMDGDGRLDIVVANRGGVISVYRNVGSGPGPLDAASFAPRVDYSVSDSDLRCLVLGDIDGDGKLDVVAGSANWKIVVVGNASSVGSVQFTPHFNLFVFGQVVSVAVGDFDGDRRPDLVGCGSDWNLVSIYRNIGAPGTLSPASFDTRFDLNGLYYPFGVMAADVDGDGRLELAVATHLGGELVVYPNIGSPGVSTGSMFGRPVIFPGAVGCFTVAAGDVNGDGKPDFALANNHQNTVLLFVNKSSGPGVAPDTFAPRVVYPAGSGPRAVMMSDVDGDGKLDLVLARAGTSQMSVLQNNLLAPQNPPVIEQHPRSQTVRSGATVSLNVTVSGTSPFQFQWRLNGTNILGANAQELVLSNAQREQSGVYSVLVSNLAGGVESADAVVVVNTAPVANAQVVSVNEDGTVAIHLVATDADNDSLTYSVGTPLHGKLTGVPPALTYSPEPNYNGPDAFAFQVSDGIVSSEAVTVNIAVTPVNDAPVAIPQSVNVAEDSTLSLTLSAFDADGDRLSYIINPPQHGTLSGLAPNLVYRPSPNYFGSDSFTFAVHDGTVSSASVTVSITVQSVNDAPVARFTVAPLFPLSSPNRLVVLAMDNTSAQVTLNASSSSDLENDPLQFQWFETSSAPFASGVQVAKVFPVGSHTVTLTVSDASDAHSTSVSFEVVRPAAIVKNLRSVVEGASLNNKSSILEGLDAAASSLDKGNRNAATGQLGAVQNKVRSQMSSSDPGCAAMVYDSIDRLVTELKKK